MPLALAVALLAAALSSHARDVGAGVYARVEPQAPANTAPKVVAALEKSKLRYEKSSDGLWSITLKGTNVSSIAVSIRAMNDLVIVASIVQRKPVLSSDTLTTLLRASYGARFSKLAVDDDGDVVALTELPKDFTVAAFEAAVQEVATLADEAAGLLSAPGRADNVSVLPEVAPGKGATVPILRGVFEVSYDPAKWRIKPANVVGVTEFQHVSGDAGLKVISERIEVARDNFRNVVIENARALAPDIAVLSEIPRTVNGLKVVVIRYGGTTSGIKFTFYNQMYSDASGTVQLAGWTGTNLFDEYQRDFLELFAGFRKAR